MVRMILESIYEPTFLNTSHGFRPKRSCHTALQYVQKNFTGVKWFVEGDIKGCFDHVDHHVLVNILRRRIQDEHFIGLIWKFLKAGYMEDWVYHNTYSGTPQGSIISPLLANIYLNELDMFVAQYAETFRQGEKRRINPAYKKPLDQRRGKQEWLKRNESKITQEQKAAVMEQIKAIDQYLRETPYGDPMDDTYKRLVYVRYADDFLIGVIGSKKDAQDIKYAVGTFLKEELKLEMSSEKTLITHARKDKAHFLGYEIFVCNDQTPKKNKNGKTRRVMGGHVMLYVPKDKWLNKLLSYHALKMTYDPVTGKEVWKSTQRKQLLHLDDLEILRQYNAEIRGIYNYYKIANNATVLEKFGYIMKYSMYKTFATKYRTRVRKIRTKYLIGKDFGIHYETKSGTKVAVFYNEGFRQQKDMATGQFDRIGQPYFRTNPNSLMNKLKARKCEWCGAEGVDLEIHHIRRLKDLKGKAAWERAMIARSRKTIALCVPCHDSLHAGKLD